MTAPRVAIVYESMFGNTASLAESVRAGLADGGADVVIADVGLAWEQALAGCDLLVLGAPTHAFSLSRPGSRSEAVAQGAAPDHAALGLREWLAALEEAGPVPVPRPSVAVFDTRVTKVRRLPGSAARSAARRLRKAGFEVAAVESFYVDDTPGPVSPGEGDRARAWGHALLRGVPAGR